MHTTAADVHEAMCTLNSPAACLSSHKVAKFKPAIETAGAALHYLPPCSPDLKPNEQVFAKLKAMLRRAQVRKREALWNAIGELLDKFSPDECERYIRHSGYFQSG